MLRFILYLTFLGLCLTIIDAKRCRKNSDCPSGYCTGWKYWRRCRPLVRPLIGDGHYCRSDDACISGQCTCNSCGRRQPNMKRCARNDNCASGWCRGMEEFGCKGVCTSKVAYGQKCLRVRRMFSANSCSRGQCTCDYCGRKMPAGYRCSTNDNCASGWCYARSGPTVPCRGRCTAKVPYGHSCLRSDGNSCSSGQCTCGKCGRKMPARYRCSTNNNCASGNCGGWITVGCRGRCK